MQTLFVVGLVAVALAGMATMGCSATPATTTADAGEAGARGIDPFCRTRPRLSFCEDFDERALPGAFDAIEGDATLFSIEARKDAPSEPRVAVLTPKDGSTDARFVTRAKEGIKFNLFFLSHLAPGHGRVDVAGMEDGAYTLVIGLDAKDTWYVEETRFDPDGGSTPALAIRTTSVKVDPNDLTAVRLDVYVDGPGKGRMRFRSGDDVVYESEALAIPPGRTTLAPKVFVGAKRREGAATTLVVDSVTLGED